MALTSDERLAIHRLGEVFTEDVRHDLTAVRGGVTESLEVLVASASALGDRNPLAHLVTNTIVSEQDGAVTATSKHLGHATDGPVGSGTYSDTLIRTPDGGRIAERRVVPRRAPLRP